METLAIYRNGIVSISYLSAIAFLPLLVLGKIGIEEAHITKIEETKSLEPSDDFGYTEHAKKLFYFLKERTSLDSYTIGINAKWREGKTFFIDLLKKQFTQNKEEVIIVDFKPWFSHSPLDIINDFFIVYGERLREEGIYIQSDLERYKNALMGIEVSDTFLNQLIKIIKNLLSNESNSSSILYDKINSVLANRKRKIIVIIDDLDRSTKEELFEVIKLVRNSGSLANTYFILAYDREYLEGALSNLSIANHEKYLEKIIQLELKLPVILATNYNSYSAKYVAENYPNYKEVWNKFLVTINDDSFSIFNAELCNIRYVQVFIDKLFYEYKSENVKSEVYFPDFILLNLMKEEKQFNTTDFVEICLQSSFIGNTGFLRVPVIEKVNDKFNDQRLAKIIELIGKNENLPKSFFSDKDRMVTYLNVFAKDLPYIPEGIYNHYILEADVSFVVQELNNNVNWKVNFLKRIVGPDNPIIDGLEEKQKKELGHKLIDVFNGILKNDSGVKVLLEYFLRDVSNPFNALITLLMEKLLVPKEQIKSDFFEIDYACIFRASALGKMIRNIQPILMDLSKEEMIEINRRFLELALKQENMSLKDKNSFVWQLQINMPADKERYIIDEQATDIFKNYLKNHLVELDNEMSDISFKDSICTFFGNENEFNLWRTRA